MHLKTGDIIGDRYTIRGKLGAGGVGEVYLAYDGQRETEVAFKVLLPQFAANTLAKKRFKREATLQRGLDHPAIVSVYDRGRIGEALFYTMEYVKGTTLKTALTRRGSFDAHETGRIVSLIAEGLDHAHGTAIHRDLSPDNIVIVRDGSVKILDFGQGKERVVSSDLTAVGIPLGKLTYSAPELRANARSADHRADIYSLGAMAFEMLTGAAPYAFEPFRDRVPATPSGCESAIAKAMATAPEDRYDSACAFANDFQAALR